MSAGSVSLTSAIQTCVVDQSAAPRLQSDRYLNPMVMMCPTWDGTNNKGQKVCPDSWYTKSIGCNSAMDRVVVENDLRPKYFDYITLTAAGINGNIYGNVDAHDESMSRKQMLDDRNLITGNFGTQFGSKIRSNSCAYSAYENAMAQEAQSMRAQGFLQNGYQAYGNRQYSGMQ